jgi:flavonol-3-O-glucoside L-rhamnosyltransferase
VAALLTQLRPDAVMFDFAIPWVCGIDAPLGIKTLLFSVFFAVSDTFLVVTAHRLQAHRSSKSDLTSPPSDFPFESSLAAIIPSY